MALPPSPCIIADLVCQTQHSYIRSRTYWSPSAAPSDESQLTVAADAIKTAFTPVYPAVMPTEHYFARVECRYYGVGGVMFFANSVAASGVGLIASPISADASEDTGSESEDIMPDDTCLIVQKKTGKSGRSKMGRLFIGGLSERINFAGQVSDAYVGAVKNLAAKVNTDVNVNGSGYVATLNGRHWDRKNNVLEPITKVYVVKAIGSRMDRRPKSLLERL